MSMMLALIQAGWSSIRSSVEQGRRTDALDRLRRLLARPDVPAAVAADAHRLAGELLIDVERYFEARRHLRAAAALDQVLSHVLLLGPCGGTRSTGLRPPGRQAIQPGEPIIAAKRRSIEPHLAARRCGAIGLAEA